jgi:tyrosyl-tRNA synthetase
MGTALKPAEQVARLVEGCDHVVTAGELEDRIAKKGRLTVKFGIDPTGTELHLGHAVVLHKMQQFVELGHRVILLIGDFTAKIGDPTGRNESRPPLTDDQIAANMRDYRAQAGKVLDLERVELMYNSTWLAPLTFADLNRLAALTTVAQMLTRNDFSERYSQGTPIGLHEFLYPVAVAYDSVMMKADVELGGSEQLYNLLMGRDYQGSLGQPKQICMTTPILVGTDGLVRMGKSRDNYVGLFESAHKQFGKLMTIPDEAIPEFARLAAFWTRDEVEELTTGLQAGSIDPMAAKKDVAKAIVALYHGAQAASAERESYGRMANASLGLSGELEAELTTVDGDWKTLAEMLIAKRLASSKREVQRLITERILLRNGVPVVGEARQAWTPVTEAVTYSIGKRLLSGGVLRAVKILPRSGS